jgi:ketosteroid isomerase-like protein
MSQENVEVVRTILDLAFVRRDFDAALRLIDAEGVVDWTHSRAPYSGIYRGHAEIRKAWEGWTEQWDEWNPQIEEAIVVDPETVVVVTLVHARVRGSGVPVIAHGASVWMVRAGKVVRARLHQSKADALEVAGLSEQDAHADP